MWPVSKPPPDCQRVTRRVRARIGAATVTCAPTATITSFEQQQERDGHEAADQQHRRPGLVVIGEVARDDARALRQGTDAVGVQAARGIGLECRTFPRRESGEHARRGRQHAASPARSSGPVSVRVQAAPITAPVRCRPSAERSTATSASMWMPAVGETRIGMAQRPWGSGAMRASRADGVPSSGTLATAPGGTLAEPPSGTLATAPGGTLAVPPSGDGRDTVEIQAGPSPDAQTR